MIDKVWTWKRHTTSPLKSLKGVKTMASCEHCTTVSNITGEWDGKSNRYLCGRCRYVLTELFPSTAEMTNCEMLDTLRNISAVLEHEHLFTEDETAKLLARAYDMGVKTGKALEAQDAVKHMAEVV